MEMPESETATSGHQRRSLGMTPENNRTKGGPVIKLDMPWSIRRVHSHESPTLSMYERMIASPTTERIDLVACTSYKLSVTNIRWERTH